MSSEWCIRSLLWWDTIAPWHFTRTIHKTILPVVDWSAWLFHAPLQLNPIDLAIIVHVLTNGGLFFKDWRTSVVTGSVGNISAANIANTLVVEGSGRIIETLLESEFVKKLTS